jgi:hypothetical protein
MFIMNFDFNNILRDAKPICLGLQRQKKHVSLIYHKNKLVSIGTNVFKTHPLANKYGYIIGCVHSELDAFNKLPKKYKKDLRKLKLVNIRMNRFEQLRNSKPCKHCLPWCIEMFDDIWYTTDTGFELLSDNERKLYE